MYGIIPGSGVRTYLGCNNAIGKYAEKPQSQPAESFRLVYSNQKSNIYTCICTKTVRGAGRLEGIAGLEPVNRHVEWAV